LVTIIGLNEATNVFAVCLVVTDRHFWPGWIVLLWPADVCGGSVVR
jgi:hypothetical protein